MKTARSLLARFGPPCALLGAVACGGSPISRPTPFHVADPIALVGEYYQRVNHEDLSGVLALFAAEPVVNEPFSTTGAQTVHRGFAAVSAFFEHTFRGRDDQIVVEFVRREGSEIVAGWSMHASDGDGASGSSRFQVGGGLIQRMDVMLRE